MPDQATQVSRRAVDARPPAVHIREDVSCTISSAKAADPVVNAAKRTIVGHCDR